MGINREPYFPTSHICEYPFEKGMQDLEMYTKCSEICVLQV
jgi:hypothetical protein